MKKVLKGILGIVVVVVLIGIGFINCGGGEPTGRPTVSIAKKKKAPKPSVAEKEEALGEEKAVGWSYDPTGKRNPFQPPRELKMAVGEINPLFKYDLEQMWIDGIVVGGGRDVAHIILPDGSDYFIKVGDEIGINHGRVKQILPDGIVVEETYLDPKDPSKIRVVEKVLRMVTAEEDKRKLREILK